MATKMNPTKRKALAKRKMEAARRARERARTRAKAKANVEARKTAYDKTYEEYIKSGGPKKKAKAKAKPKKKKVSREEQSATDMENIKERQKAEKAVGIRRGGN